MPSFTYLYIPTDKTADLEERVVEYAAADEVGCLMAALSRHFAAVSGPASKTAALAATKKVLVEEAKKKGVVADDATLDLLASTQMVDQLPLNTASRSNDWTYVSVYSDDSAVNKGLEMNERATALSCACGKMVRVMGDAFVARAQDDNHDLYHRLDFTAADYTPDAPWVASAKAENEPAQAKSAGAAGGGQTTKAIAAKVAAPPSAERLAAFAAELEAWVVGKLAQFDAGDAAFQAGKERKHGGSRAGYETWLRGKATDKLAAHSAK
jgi:hypothetical protein